MPKFSIVLLITAISFLPSANAAEFLRESIAKDYDENLAELYLHFHQNRSYQTWKPKPQNVLQAK